MKNKPSKSSFSKNNKTAISKATQSKKSSRIVKAQSCVKIQSIDSENSNKFQPISTTTQTKITPSLLKQNFSSKNISKYSINQPQISMERPIISNNQSSRSYERTMLQVISNRHQQQLKFHQIMLKNQQLTKQNASLKVKCNEMQDMSLRDKQKIKNLIVRINEIKESNNKAAATEQKDNKMSTTNLALHNINENSQSKGYIVFKGKIETPYKALGQAALGQGACDNKECLQKRKYLQSQLYKQRMMHDKLQIQKRQWQRNREQLKHQYNSLLNEIREMRDKDF